VVEDLKRALGSVVLRDLNEQGRKGWRVGESLRVYQEAGGLTLAFLRGTDEKTRKLYRDKLTTAGVSCKVGKDFEL
jgi:hypothetical protein